MIQIHEQGFQAGFFDEILKERSVSVHPTTIMRWGHEYGNLIYHLGERSLSLSTKWGMGENGIIWGISNYLAHHQNPGMTKSMTCFQT
ncbi:hypothetical protein AN161_12730 [Lysinibacillus sp. FJAT-14222]|nr:hypothetical protein AN161_12730 [Lysinibacillus sp. FJAT-14222]